LEEKLLSIVEENVMIGDTRRLRSTTTQSLIFRIFGGRGYKVELAEASS
jgi:hypothetical protein